MKRASYRSKMITILSVLLCVIMLVVGLSPIIVHAQRTEQTKEAEEKVVRVGFYPSIFNYKNDVGKLTGYGYDYQQMLSAYTGWKYEYVTGSWVELLDMLSKGEIDLLSDVSYLETREKDMLFSTKPMGIEHYYLYVLQSNEELEREDASKLEGKRVGEADCIFLTTYRVSNLESSIKKYDLSVIYMDKEFPMTLAVKRADRQLLSILNKMIALIPKSIQSSSLAQHSYVEKTVTPYDFLVDNLLLVLVIFVLIISIIITLLAESRIAERKMQKAERKLEQSNVKLMKANSEQQTQLGVIGRLNDELSSEKTVLQRQYDLSSVLSKDVLDVFMVDIHNAISKTVKVHGQIISEDQRKGRSYFNTWKQYVEQHVHEEDREQLLKSVALSTVIQKLDTEEDYICKYRYIEDGRVRFFQVFFSYLGEKKSGLIVFGFRCIDEIVRAEREQYEALKKAKDTAEARLVEIQRLNEMLEQANRSKTVFLNNMSHDIRTPMNAIIGFTNLMQNELNNPEKIQEYLQKIQDSGDYLLALINNVLDMARIESGNVKLNEHVFCTEKEGAKVLSVFESAIRKKKQVLTSSMEIEHPYIYCDELKLRQIWLNLLSNAVKYTPEGGHIHIHTKEYPDEREGYVMFETTLTDDGIGMSQEFVTHIFDSFSREQTTTECKVVGTGLGMSIVKRLVDLMDGTIEVDSELGKGTTFTVRIAHRIVEDTEGLQEEQENISEQEIDFTGKRILLAEDNELNAEIAMAILENVGIVVEHAEDGSICVDMLEKADAHYYDLILMDIQMPNMDGYQATEKIRHLTDEEKAKIPIIAMTANAFEEDRQHALEIGMNEHLAKPIEIPKLMEALRNVL